MKAAAMDPATDRVVRAILCVPDEPLPQEFALLLLADRDRQAIRAERAEARNAAVIDVMRSMDDTRGKLVNAAWVAKAQLGFVIEELRVALGLPSEWRDGAIEPVAKGYQDTPLTADDLVRRAVRNAGHGEDHPKPRWSWVARVFGLGSTSSTELCRRFDLDPDEMRGEYPDDDECDMRDGGEG